MTTRVKIALCLVTVITSYAFGRYSAPEKVKIETKIVEVEKKTEDKSSDAKRHKKTTITVIELPDGSKKTTTVITDDVSKTTDDKLVDDKSKQTDKTKEVTKGGSKLNISALTGVDFTRPGVPVYGAHVSKEILGPISVGAWGLTNKTVGVSIGLAF